MTEEITTIEWKEVNPNIWTPEKEGDSIEGMFMGTEEKVGDNESTLYHLKNPETNEITSIWGSHVLDQRMKLVSLGSRIRIVFKEIVESKKKGRQVKIFQVFEAESK